MFMATAGVSMILLASCASDTPDGLDGSQGRVIPVVGVDGTVTDAIPATRASQAAQIDAAQMSLRLKKADGSYAETWNSVADFPTDKGFPIGQYTLEAFYGDPESEGFDAPYYYGVCDVNVAEGAAAEARITAQLANTMVSLDYTDTFKNYFTTYSAQIHAEGGDYISFEKDETRPAYCRTGEVTLIIHITKPNGLSADIEAATFVAQPRHHYHVTLELNEGQMGDGAISVVFDDSVVTEELPVIDISDSAMLAPGPQVTATNFTPGTAEEVEEGEPLSGARMTLNAPAGLSAVTLTTQSANLLGRGFPAEIELVHATGAQQALLEDFGLKVKGVYNNPDKMAVLDFEQLVAGITAAGNSVFTVVAKDRHGKVNEPVSLNVKTRAVNTSITALPDIRIDQTAATMTVGFDGTRFADKLSLQYEDATGWHNATVTSVAADGTNSYTVNFNVPAEYRHYPVRLGISNRIKATGTLKKTGVLLSANDYDIWATHGTFTVEKNQAVAMSDITYYYSTDGTNFTQAASTANGNKVELTGLPAGKALHIYGSDTGASSGVYRPCDVTTEAAAQLPNWDMEDWYVGASGSHWKRYYLGTDDKGPWGTNNPMTTSSGVDEATTRSSGTLPSSEHTQGSNSALIRTLGWGAGNTAAGSWSACYNEDSGLLHLGNNRSSAQDPINTNGIGFTSRPASISFDYKYTTQSKATDDYGNVLVTVYDASHNVIATTTQNLSSSSFSTLTLPLNYTVTNKKAAYIYVKFISTVESRFLNKDKLTPPGFANLNASWLGSQLIVDNIRLNY